MCIGVFSNMRLQKLFETSYSKDRVPVSADGMESNSHDIICLRFRKPISHKRVKFSTHLIEVFCQKNFDKTKN